MQHLVNSQTDVLARMQVFIAFEMDETQCKLDTPGDISACSSDTTKASFKAVNSGHSITGTGHPGWNCCSWLRSCINRRSGSLSQEHGEERAVFKVVWS